MLEITNLHADVGGKPILKGLSLAINAGEIHAIMGPNGAGKSTLSYVLGGRPGYEVTGGSVTFTPQPRHPRAGGDPASEQPAAQRLDAAAGTDAAASELAGLGSRLRGNDERSGSGNDEGSGSGNDDGVGVDLLALAPHERAAAGLFLGFQYPVEIPGVSFVQFLRESLNSQRKARGQAPLSGAEFLKLAREKAALLRLDMDMLKRPVNVGFSGGEKKRAEMVQMAILDPRLAILDETDSGLDIDALRVVGDGINAIMRRPDKAVLLITHYQRLLDYVRPDFVHILSDGRIVKTGGAELAHRLEAEGYEALQEPVGAA